MTMDVMIFVLCIFTSKLLAHGPESFCQGGCFDPLCIALEGEQQSTISSLVFPVYGGKQVRMLVSTYKIPHQN